MSTVVDLSAIESPSRAAAILCENWPAVGLFRGVRLRARYATTNPADLVRHYMLRVDGFVRDVVYADARRRREIRTVDIDADVRRNAPYPFDDVTVAINRRAASENEHQIVNTLPGPHRFVQSQGGVCSVCSDIMASSIHDASRRSDLLSGNGAALILSVPPVLAPRPTPVPTAPIESNGGTAIRCALCSRIGKARLVSGEWRPFAHKTPAGQPCDGHKRAGVWV